MPRKRRYPFAPLERHLAIRLGEVVVEGGNGGQVIVDLAGVPAMAEFLGVHRRHVQRWRTSGLTAEEAERAAVKAGFVAYELWPELLDEAIAEQVRTCASEGCDETFMLNLGTGGHNRRFCGDGCRRHEAKRLAGELADRCERVCAADDCDETFVPDGAGGGANRLYCSKRCARRVNMRRQRQRPEVQEKMRVYARRYYAEAGDYVRAQQRRRDAEKRAAERAAREAA